MLTCLQDFRHELRSEACHAAVHRTLARAASDVRFEPAFQAHCGKDYVKHCDGVQPVRGFCALQNCFGNALAAAAAAS